MLDGAIEGLATLERRREAGELYPLALQALDDGNVVDSRGRSLLQTTAGIAAACTRDFDAAEGHYHKALRLADEIPFRSEQPEARRWYARMLLDRDGAGDRGWAETLLDEAIASYGEIGMPRHVELAGRLREKL